MKIENFVRIQKFYEVLKSNPQIEIVNSNIELLKNDELEKRLLDLDIDFDDLGNKFRLNVPSLPFKFFFSIKDFETYWLFDELNDVLIFDSNSPIIWCNGLQYQNFIEVDSFYFKNCLSYKKFISILKDQEFERDNGFQFTDSMNLDFCKIVFINNLGNTRLNIKYNESFKGIKNSYDYSGGLTKFIDCFKHLDKNFARFLKSSFIEFGNTESSSDKLLINIFENLDQIVYKAEMNFEVYLSELSIDKFKKDYDEFKTKYFKELSDTLSKISQKIIILPVGVSASLVAIEKIKADHIFLILLFLIILSTSLFLSFLINSNLKDLSYLYKLFNFEYNQLKSNLFFQKYPSEFNFFKEIRDNIHGKVKFYSALSNVFYWVMNLANLFLIIFILSCFDLFTNNSLVLLSLIFLIITGLGFQKLSKIEYT